MSAPRELKISNSGVSYSCPVSAGGLSVIFEISWIGLSLAAMNVYALYRMLKSWGSSDEKEVNEGIIRLRRLFLQGNDEI